MDAKKVPRYEMLERMGEGGMGVVYRARDPRLDRIVAIKFLSAALSSDASAKARFIQEAKAASALDHPNICAIYEIDEDEGGQLFIVMAYYEGRTLDDIIAQGPLPAGEALAVMVQVADGLAKAHAKGIVHRDVKPSNVMLTQDGVAKILDFGLAKVAGAEGVTRTGHSVGTPAYMAPEQIKGEPVDHRADIWALGVMLFELSTGQHPFRGEHPQAVMYQVVNETPRPLSDVWPEAPAGVQEIIDRCLQKDPAARYPEAAQLRNDLRVVLDRVRGSAGEFVSTDAYASTVAAALRIERDEERKSRVAAVRRGAVATLAVIGLAAVVWGGIRFFGQPGEALRVLVLPPVVEATVDTTTAALVASNVEVALFRGLASMKNVVAVEAPKDTSLTTPQELARAVAADDVISVSLRDTGSQWQVAMRRIVGGDGTVAWAESFDAPHDEPLTLANAINARLGAGFPDRSAKSSAMEVSPDDYAAFVRQHSRFIREGATGAAAVSMLDTLAAIRGSSPRFLESYLLESKIARMMFDSSHEGDLLDRARSAAESARQLAPQDPRAVGYLFDVTLRSGDLESAKKMIGELKRVNPGSVELLRQEALVAEREGDSERALALLRKVVERRPARAYLVDLIRIEYDQGLHNDARAHIADLLRRFPGNNYGRSKLAEIELVYGNAARAAELYHELVEEFPTSLVKISNLGLAYELVGNYAAAASTMRRAVALAPDDPAVVLNLADCEKMLGNAARADSLYADVLRLIDASEDPRDLANMRMQAQCLAHLGQNAAAVTMVQDVLGRDSENAWSYFAAAVVYAVVGERTSALVNARIAAGKGVTGRWFQLDFFRSLRADPEFRSLLDSDPPR